MGFSSVRGGLCFALRVLCRVWTCSLLLLCECEMVMFAAASCLFSSPLVSFASKSSSSDVLSFSVVVFGNVLV